MSEAVDPAAPITPAEQARVLDAMSPLFDAHYLFPDVAKAMNAALRNAERREGYARHFTLLVPQGRPLSPVTGTNWEGTGVIPDVVVAPDAAPKEALARATRGGRADGPGPREGAVARCSQAVRGPRPTW